MSEYKCVLFSPLGDYNNYILSGVMTLMHSCRQRVRLGALFFKNNIINTIRSVQNVC